MENVQWISITWFNCHWLLLSFISLIIFLLLLKNYKPSTPHNLPPTPPKLPIIGNLHQLGKHPHRSLLKLSNKYGPAMLLHLGSVPTLVISSAETAREVLKIHDSVCCTRPLLSCAKRLSYNFSDIGFSPYSAYWREMRKICTLKFLSVKRIKSFRFLREEEVLSMVNSISQTSPNPVNLTEHLFSLMHRIVCRSAFGKSCAEKGFGNGGFQEAVTEAVTLLRSFSAADHFPYVGWILDLLSGFNARLEKNFHEVDGFLQWVINDHLQPTTTNFSDHHDITHLLLQLQKDDLNGINLTQDHIKAILMNIFVAGIETSSATMVWAMAELAKNHQIMHKLQKEIRDCIKCKGKVEESDLDKLVYLKMVLKETMRLHPASSFLIPRETISHCKINGYDIYPKTRIEVNAWAIGRDAKHWERPEEFWPERFIGSSIEFNGQNFEFLPFGSGRRGCPGMNMAVVTMELALANLLYSYNWELPSGVKDVSMDESAGVAIHPLAPLFLVPIKF